MDRRDRRDQRHVRTRHLNEAFDFAGVIYANLENAEVGGGRHARQGQRHTPVIVVGGGRSVCRATLRQHHPQHLLYARLADRTGHRDDARPCAGARGDAKALHRDQRVVGCKDGTQMRERGRPLALNDRRRRARLECARDKIVAVMRLAVDGDEQIAGLERAGIDRNPADLPFHRFAGGGQSLRKLRFGPKHSHPASAKAARVSSASLNGSVLSPTICPIS